VRYPGLGAATPGSGRRRSGRSKGRRARAHVDCCIVSCWSPVADTGQVGRAGKLAFGSVRFGSVPRAGLLPLRQHRSLRPRGISHLSAFMQCNVSRQPLWPTRGHGFCVRTDTHTHTHTPTPVAWHMCRTRFISVVRKRQPPLKSPKGPHTGAHVPAGSDTL
jgi:hypothetical protein